MASSENHATIAAIKPIALSTAFARIPDWRAQLLRALMSSGTHAVEFSEGVAQLNADVLQSSLRRVRNSAAYVGYVGGKYGPIPDDLKGNPEQLSIADLEFNEAIRFKVPTLMFVMGEQYPMGWINKERSPQKRKKLEAFIQRIQSMDAYEDNIHLYAVVQDPGAVFFLDRPRRL
jgi:hypothetical protein